MKISVSFMCMDRCRDCGAVLEEYDEETLALAVVVLSMFTHLSPDLAAPLLLDIMQSVGRYSLHCTAHSANYNNLLFFIFFGNKHMKPHSVKLKILADKIIVFGCEMN